MSNRRKLQKNLEVMIGASSLLLAHIVSLVLFGLIIKKIEPYSSAEWIQYAVMLTAAFLLVYFYFYSPLNMLKRSRPMEFMSTAMNCLLTYGMFGAMLILTKNEIIASRYLFLSSFVFNFAFSLAGRFVLKKVFLGKIRESRFATMCGVISNCSRAEKFISSLKIDWSQNIKAVALVDVYSIGDTYLRYDNGEQIESIDGVPVVAGRDNLIGWIRTASLDDVYINLDRDFAEKIKLPSLIEELEDMGITVHVNIPSMEDIFAESKFNYLNCVVKAGYPMAVFSPVNHNPSNLMIKRIADFIGGLVGTILSLPIIAVVAIPLKLDSPGPLIFRQQRVGKNGRVFYIYKLRSMYIDAEARKKELEKENKMEGHMFKMDNDPRITKVGRFIRKYSIDELPQFWNVLKGDMSLVGTRPPTIEEFEKYESHHKRRLSMKPGITGNWQVSGRSDIQDFEEVVKLDCEYIDNWSPLYDTKILFKTVGVVLLHKGAE
jgi:exopolysaccharide biosynthesis polyprenyl glycosylphosphotransferase